MNFKVGDRVDVLDEDISGVICKITGETVVIETEDDFNLSFSSKELIKQKALTVNVFNNENYNTVIKEKEDVKKTKSTKIRPKDRSLPAMEVDLHIQQITTKFKHLSNFEILKLQLDTARYKLEFAIKKRIQKMVFIHGVGDGVLKSELEYLFRRYDHLNYYPADYQKYGQGATEVYIKQNINL